MQYIAQKEVKTVEALPEKHNGTIDLVKVTYADDSTETLTKKCFDVSVTDAPLDSTSLRDKRIEPVIKAILELLLDWGINVEDVNFIVANIPLSVNAAMNAANAKLWGKPEHDLNLIEVDRVLKRTTTVEDILAGQ